MKIRGNTVGTPLRPEKNLVKATNLTEEEKAQARQNIGAAAVCDLDSGVRIINYDGSGQLPKEDVDVIADCIRWREEVIIYIGFDPASCQYYRLVGVSEDEEDYETNVFTSAEFTACELDHAYSLEVLRDGTVTTSSQRIVSTDTTLTQAGKAADAKVVGDKLGDIDTALDHIIALQDELIGGEAE